MEQHRSTPFLTRLLDMQQHYTAVLGFGNPVRSDDAIGIYVIEQLQRKIDTTAQVSFFDMGTSAFEVLFKLNGHTRLILIDAVVNTGEAVGMCYKLPADAVMAEIQNDPMVFLHSLKWNQALSYAKKILRENFPTEIDVYLIAIDDTRLEIQLSDAARAAGDKVVQLILNDLAAQVAHV